ncbi:protein-L-isoaspartate(D-aspartate) O-methyltransferase [Pelistega europaea]|uniref:Protein-L-isoaspartate O-methyltransferase n=2 Tax=Pelistega europaea TaxID=106147 RepID=A0A7Y4L9Y6_9BURK|nr:protein-L-isoaspartate(D-aspartate) O-methyltransferase [Pelistega europaea]
MAVRTVRPASQLLHKLSGLSQNSNTRIMRGNKLIGVSPSETIRTQVKSVLSRNEGLNSDQLRINMVARLRTEKGITDERVLRALIQVQRHLFMDPGTAVRAYEDAALPIGYGQTISMPSVVARMISVAIQDREAGRVLEIGSGCGYQAAVLACIFKEVYSIERIAGLHELAKRNAARIIGLPPIQFIFGDGMLGLPDKAPFDTIVIAAAGLSIPQALLSQLSVGGRLIAPEGEQQQKLVLIERKGAQEWARQELEATRFVPLRPGIQR